MLSVHFIACKEKNGAGSAGQRLRPGGWKAFNDNCLGYGKFIPIRFGAFPLGGASVLGVFVGIGLNILASKRNVCFILTMQ